MHAVVALALPAVEAFDLAIPAQVFADPGLPRRYEFTVCAPAAGLVRSTAGFSVHAEHGLDALAAADTVVVPGYLPLGDPGERVCSALRQAAARGARMVSVCTGAFALAAAGLLDHRRATTHWQYAGQLAARYPAVKVDPDVLWVDEGAVLTSAGLAAGIDLCVQLVRADHGSEAAVSVARRMVVAPHRDGGQAQYVDQPIAPTCDGTLRDLLEWLRAHLDQPLTVRQLAARANMSERTFARRFVQDTGTTPQRWLIGQRILLAQQLLEESDETVDAIADRTGFGNATALRHHFRAWRGTTPNAYRRLFRGPSGLASRVISGL